VVIQTANTLKSAILESSPSPDYYATTDWDTANWLVASKKRTILPFGMFEKLGKPTVCYPLVDANELALIAKETTAFLKIGLSDITPSLIEWLKLHPSTIIIAHSTHLNVLAEMRSFIWTLQGNDITNPVVMHRNYTSAGAEDLQVQMGAELGALFLDGMADGVFAENAAIDETQLLSAQYGLLQASRVRFSKTEYISCPGCGRTLFALQEITEQIKQRTSHLKGLKIGVMGCIVNGIGEMADADYGYVGSGPGKVSLFKQKELVQRNIPTEEALEALVTLIKESGDWKEPDK
jgi:(E)-4-hydroxy-3-methylbut-2-enyl-diphosphate synthase